MKYIITLFSFCLVAFVYGQDTAKVKTVDSNKTISPVVKYKFPNSSIKTIEGNRRAPRYKGTFVLDEYDIQVSSRSAKKTAQSLTETTFNISENSISGEGIDTISFQVNDVEIMDAEDYIYRNFNAVPNGVPAGLPANLRVHKTNNPDCYGIVELPDGRIIIPYKGILLFLKRA